ncbi:MAG: S41 family peptidase [Alphaproteobacteria bacterium]|nr:S41 family peptidase [Alphaproteobacteria bacterium]
MKSFYLALGLALAPAITAATATLPVAAQDQVQPLGEQERADVVTAVSSQLRANYVFPETADKMAAAIGEKLNSGSYAGFADPMRFAEQLTEDLRAISHDGHLRVMFNPQQVADMRRMADNPQRGLPQGALERMRRDNYGFREVKILDGNVAYINLTGFIGTEFAEETAVAAMNYVSNADALIFDLRQNGGGEPSMIQLLISYLYDEKPVHLNTFYWRPTDTHTETWTHRKVKGKRRPDMDVYVLTSDYTFSAAEEFSYDLKNLRRATLVGETTGGGAHPGGPQVATDRFTVWVPNGRAINPITGTNWEGTGVEPHVKTAATDALDVAHAAALEKLAGAHEGPDGAYYRWHYLATKARTNPVSLSADAQAALVGNFGVRSIKLQDGQLMYQRRGRPMLPISPLTEDTFAVEGIPYFRLQFIREGGEVTALRGIYDNGTEDLNAKDS